MSLKACIKEAQRRGLVGQNVAQPVSIKIGGRHRPHIEVPSREEIRDLLARAQGRDRVLLVLLVFTGLQISECRGLRWQDVYLEDRVIRVYQRASLAGRIGPLKSAAARRDVPMAPLVANALREWRLQSPGELVFAGNRPGVPASYNMLRSNLGPLHRYRHAFVSWLIDQGLNAKRVSVLAGHSSIQMTFDVYGHLLVESDLHERFAAGQLALVGK